MSKAFCLIKQEPHYRRDAFMAGLKAAGFDARTGGPRDVVAGDVLVTWNRYYDTHEMACRFERLGGVVLVAENGYIGPGGVSPHQMQPREWYALAIGGHNGSGTWPAGDSSRWDVLGVDLKRWRAEGEHILVCPNRSFGRPDLIMPLRWAEDVKARFSKATKREIRIRPHPGNGAHRTPLAEDLAGAWACIIWSSSAGVQALMAGIPVICEAPRWICRGATGPTPERALEMGRDAREYEMRGLAWAQWHVDEIASGKPFDHLLRATREAEVAAGA